ncbi:MAG: transketolase C-terminal domain-containing protein [Geodermatophilaceae bacterium]
MINPRWIKPLDTGTLEFFARAAQVICTLEDHVLHNGFGCAVMEHLHTQMINTPGGPHRLARSVHRAWHDSHSAEEAWSHCRSARRKGVAAFTEDQSTTAAAQCGLKPRVSN